MRKRWTSQKRSLSGASDPGGSELDRVDSSISLQDPVPLLADVETVEDSEPGELDGSLASASFQFVEPTPKPAPRDDGKRSRITIEDLDDDQGSSVEGGSKLQTASTFSKESLQKNSLDATNFKMFKQPWEKGAMSKLFGEQFDFGRKVPSLEAGDSRGWSLKLGWKEQAIESTTIEAVELLPSAAIFQQVVKVAPERDYFEEREFKRVKAVEQWWTLISTSLSDSAVGRQILDESTLENFEQYGKELLEATFGLKSPNTLLKRFYALKSYATWCSDVQASPWLPVVETEVWNYMRWLKATDAPPTRATSLVEAIRFGWYVLGLAGAGEVQSSLRLKGIASQMFIKKKPWRPAALLEVKEVIAIHRFLQDETKDLVDRVFAGHMLHLLYVRGRWSDLAAVQHGEVDEDGKFFELSTQHHKGAKGQESKSRLLPLVAPCCGITGDDWCKTYLEVREKAGLQLPQKVPLAMLLAPAKNCGMDWTSRALTSHEGSDFLRKVLGLAPDSERRVSTHSLKSTAISWCSKFGLCFESRALLARHISAVANPTALYSRDLVSAVMREFCQVINYIAEAKFEPDRTRSGMLTPVFGQVPTTPTGPTAAARFLGHELEEVQDLPHESPQEETALDLRSPGPLASFDDHLGKEGGPMELAANDPQQVDERELSESSESDLSSESSSDEANLEDQQSEKIESLGKPAEPSVGDFFINNKSLVIHLISKPGVFKCGRKLGWLFTKVPNLNGIRCSRCFNL